MCRIPSQAARSHALPGQPARRRRALRPTRAATRLRAGGGRDRGRCSVRLLRCGWYYQLVGPSTSASTGAQQSAGGSGSRHCRQAERSRFSSSGKRARQGQTGPREASNRPNRTRGPHPPSSRRTRNGRALAGCTHAVSRRLSTWRRYLQKRGQAGCDPRQGVALPVRLA